jgi:hypothetical protein
LQTDTFDCMKRSIHMIYGFAGNRARNLIILEYKNLSLLSIFEVSTSCFTMSALSIVIDRRPNITRFCYRALEIRSNRFFTPKIRGFENLSPPSFFEIRFHDLHTLNTAYFLSDPRTNIFKFVSEFCYRTPTVKCVS